MSEQYHIRLIGDIEQMTPTQWNAITGESLQRSYRWQQYKQASQAASWPRAWTHFVTVWRGDTLVGVASAYQYPMPLPLELPFLRRLSQIALAPTNPINFLLPPMVLRGEDETAVYPLLLQGIRQLIRKKFALGVRLTFLDAQHHALLLTHLRQANYLITDGIWENDLMLEWPTFDGYVQSLKSSHRNSLRKQLKKVDRAGIVITTAMPTDAQHIYSLFANVAAKNKSQLLYNQNVLHHAQTILGDDHFKLFRAVHNGKTVACLMMYHDQQTAQLAAIGLDYDVSNQYNLYRVLIYSAIEKSINLGLHCVRGGMSKYELKRRIGFVSRPTLTATDAWLSPIKRGYSFTPDSLQDSD